MRILERPGRLFAARDSDLPHLDARLLSLLDRKGVDPGRNAFFRERYEAAHLRAVIAGRDDRARVHDDPVQCRLFDMEAREVGCIVRLFIARRFHYTCCLPA